MEDGKRCQEGEHVNEEECARPMCKMKGRLHIAMLNMRGYSTHMGPGKPSDKWNCIGQFMRSEKVAILVVQEMHLMTQRIDKLNKFFKVTMVVSGSMDQEA